jgi:acyl dehydratase
MTHNPHPDGFYLEDLSPGQRFSSASRTIDKARIIAFAEEFDPQPFHLDEAQAAATVFGGLAASGFHTTALTMRMLLDGGLPIAGGVVGVNVEIAWPRPTRPGDVLHVETEILEVRPSASRPDRGVVIVRGETLNGRGEAVQVSTMRLIVPRRPAPPA